MCVRVFSVGFGPGLDSMSPARSRRSASHVAGTHGWLPQKTGRPGLRRGGVGGYNLHSPPDCGTPTTSRLYPFGATFPCHIAHCSFMGSRCACLTDLLLCEVPCFRSISNCWLYILSIHFSFNLNMELSAQNLAILA